MRTDPRYDRVRAMLTNQAVPRLQNGGIALCHLCQRSVYFAGGFLELLTKMLQRKASDARVPGVCPRCGHAKLYRITRGDLKRCAACRYEFSETVGTERQDGKKPKSWYDQITKLHDRGLRPLQIAKIMGHDQKPIYDFIYRLRATRQIKAALATAADERTD